MAWKTGFHLTPSSPKKVSSCQLSPSLPSQGMTHSRGSCLAQYESPSAIRHTSASFARTVNTVHLHGKDWYTSPYHLRPSIPQPFSCLQAISPDWSDRASRLRGWDTKMACDFLVGSQYQATSLLSTENMGFNPLPSRFWRLYHHPTRPEVHLEPLVAALGVPYRFQYPIPGTPWFADYSFPTLKVLLEIDGESHRRKGAAEKDAARDKRTSELGWATVRVSNETALATHSPETVRRWVEAARSAASSSESDCKMSDSSIPPWLSTPRDLTTAPTSNRGHSPAVSGRLPRGGSANSSAPSGKGKRRPKGDK